MEKAGKENNNGTPMSVKLQRWREKKKEEKKSVISNKLPTSKQAKGTAHLTEKASNVNTKTCQSAKLGKTCRTDSVYKVKTISGKNQTVKNSIRREPSQTKCEVKQNNHAKTTQQKPSNTVRTKLSAESSKSRENKVVNSLKRPPLTHLTPKEAGKIPKISQKTSNAVKVAKSGNNVASNSNKTTKCDRNVSHFFKTKTVSKQNTNVKPVLKRRHSEVTVPHLEKQAGILKRKSCLPSIPDSESFKEAMSSDPLLSLSSRSVKTPSKVRFLSPNTAKSSQQQVPFRKTPMKKTQESIRAKLDDWLKAKGKTPSKFRHLMCFDAHLSAKKKLDPKARRSLTVQELSQQQATIEREESVVKNLEDNFKMADDQLSSRGSCSDDFSLDDQLDSMLDECTTLYEAGCPLQDTLHWLDQIQDNVPLAATSAKFYICKAKILQASADSERVLQVFEAAVRNHAQPAEELARSLTEIIQEVITEKEKQARRHASLQRQVEESNMFESSAIKYVVKQVTPFSKRKRKSSGVCSSPSSTCAVVTPVRRSTRRSLVDLPDTFHDKTPVYNKLEDIGSEERKQTLFMPNSALTLEDDVF